MNYPNLEQLCRKYDLLLGSGSPRRFQLLSELKLRFDQKTPDIIEEIRHDEAPFPFAQRLAEEKALSLTSELSTNQIVIGCDTIVVLDNQVLGKPDDERHALETLSQLSGKKHIVCTAIAYANSEGLLESGYETTDVYFNNVSNEQIIAYIATGEPMDKAGAYGIQGMGAFLVDRIDGNLDTVIGLPRLLLDKLARHILAS